MVFTRDEIYEERVWVIRDRGHLLLEESEIAQFTPVSTLGPLGSIEIEYYNWQCQQFVNLENKLVPQELIEYDLSDHELDLLFNGPGTERTYTPHPTFDWTPSS